MLMMDIAHEMMKAGSNARREAEKMFGKAFEDMTQAERQLAMVCLAAFDGVWNGGKA